MKLLQFTCLVIVVSPGLCQLIEDMYFEENMMTNVFNFKLRIIPWLFNVTWEKLAKNGSFCQVRTNGNIQIINGYRSTALRVINLTENETGLYRVNVTTDKESDTRNLTMCNCKSLPIQQLEMNENTMTINRSSFTVAAILACVIVVGSLLISAILITRRRYDNKKENKGGDGAAISNMDIPSTHAYADIDADYESLRAARVDSHGYDREQSSTDDRISNPYLTPIDGNEDSRSESLIDDGVQIRKTFRLSKILSKQQHRNINVHSGKEDSTDNLFQDIYAKPKNKNDDKTYYENCNRLHQKSNIDGDLLQPKAACPIIRIEKSRLT